MGKSPSEGIGRQETLRERTGGARRDAEGVHQRGARRAERTDEGEGFIERTCGVDMRQEEAGRDLRLGESRQEVACVSRAAQSSCGRSPEVVEG